MQHTPTAVKHKKLDHNFVLILYNFLHQVPNFVHSCFFRYQQFKFDGLETCTPTKCSFNIKNSIIILYNFVHKVPNLEGRVYKIWDLRYKIVQNEYKIMIHFFMLKLHLGGLHVSNPKIWTVDCGRRKGVQNMGLGVQNYTKWVQYYDAVFYVENAFGGCRSPIPLYQIWISDSWRRKDVQNVGLRVQNCTKWVQNFDPVFYVETAFRGATGLQPSKFELRIAEEGSVFKIWDLGYKIVQMSTKLWSSFLCWNCIWGLQVTSPQIWIADNARSKGVQNLGLGVQIV